MYKAELRLNRKIRHAVYLWGSGLDGLDTGSDMLAAFRRLGQSSTIAKHKRPSSNALQRVGQRTYG